MLREDLATTMWLAREVALKGPCAPPAQPARASPAPMARRLRRVRTAGAATPRGDSTRGICPFVPVLMPCSLCLLGGAISEKDHYCLITLRFA
jgi:hypothetical protein